MLLSPLPQDVASKGSLYGCGERSQPLKDPMDKTLICAGLITSSHGIQGHVKVKTFLENPKDFLAYTHFYNEEGEPVYEVIRILSHAQGGVILALKGITTRTQADGLKGHKMMLLRSQLSPLIEDTFYHTDLIGLQVISSEGVNIGRVHGVHNFGAGDLLEIKTLSQKHELIPFSHSVVPEIDLAQGFLKLGPEANAFLRGGAHDA